VEKVTNKCKYILLLVPKREHIAYSLFFFCRLRSSQAHSLKLRPSQTHSLLLFLSLFKMSTSKDVSFSHTSLNACIELSLGCMELSLGCMELSLGLLGRMLKGLALVCFRIGNLRKLGIFSNSTRKREEKEIRLVSK